MQYVLINPLSDNGTGDRKREEVGRIVKGEYQVLNLLEVKMKAWIKTLNAEDEVILSGDDGTINRFINDLDGECPVNPVYLWKGGTGNDFLKDIGKDDELVLLNPYLKHLPKVTVKGETRYFLNGIGYGIDGYCCEVADKIKSRNPHKKINYTSIAIKGILFHFHKVDATVTVDGQSETYRNVWLSPTMNGRFYGGGMMVAPDQNRLAEDHALTNMVYRTKSRLKALIVFPSIFKGEHIAHTDVVTLKKGKCIEVTFSKPCALQIDGETVLDVTSYRVEA